MIDSRMSLAFSLHSNPGAYAALIGSGVSVGAGILTGWQVMLDLISKVARVLGDDPGDDVAGWYQERFGKEPDYSVLLNTLAKSPAERNALLRSYIEPTADERARGVKVPGAAHTALADLAATGHIRLFVTTNFDRLIEQALLAAGITPNVLSTPDSILGSPPISQAGCTVLKLHGDYLDTRIKNTPAELDSYDEVVDELLDRINEEHGFIVCGWSAAWDTALRRAFERSKSRRYTTYWADVVPPGEQASLLIELLHGEFVEVEGADTFFTDVVEKLKRLSDTVCTQGVSEARATTDNRGTSWRRLMEREITFGGDVSAKDLLTLARIMRASEEEIEDAKRLVKEVKSQRLSISPRIYLSIALIATIAILSAIVVTTNLVDAFLLTVLVFASVITCYISASIRAKRSVGPLPTKGPTLDRASVREIVVPAKMGKNSPQECKVLFDKPAPESGVLVTVEASNFWFLGVSAHQSEIPFPRKAIFVVPPGEQELRFYVNGDKPPFLRSVKSTVRVKVDNTLFESKSILIRGRSGVFRSML